MLLMRRCSCPVHNVHRKPDDDYDNRDDDAGVDHDDHYDQVINDDDAGLALLLFSLQT